MYPGTQHTSIKSKKIKVTLDNPQDVVPLIMLVLVNVDFYIKMNLENKSQLSERRLTQPFFPNSTQDLLNSSVGWDSAYALIFHWILISQCPHHLRAVPPMCVKISFPEQRGEEIPWCTEETDLKSSTFSLPIDFLKKLVEKIANCNHLITGHLARGCKWEEVAKHPKCSHIWLQGEGWQPFTMIEVAVPAIVKHPFQSHCKCKQL